jgi:hypothetical protein
MILVVQSSGNITQSSLSFVWTGTEDGIRTYELNPVNDCGSITFNKYTVTEEGYNQYEDFYSFRNGNWYLYSHFEGRDCDGQHSSEGEFLWDGGKWVKLGRLRVRDYTAESMGY